MRDEGTGALGAKECRGNVSLFFLPYFLLLPILAHSPSKIIKLVFSRLVYFESEGL
jgi:hypothetical protein